MTGAIGHAASKGSPEREHLEVFLIQKDIIHEILAKILLVLAAHEQTLGTLKTDLRKKASRNNGPSPSRQRL